MKFQKSIAGQCSIGGGKNSIPPFEEYPGDKNVKGFFRGKVVGTGCLDFFFSFIRPDANGIAYSIKEVWMKFLNNDGEYN